MQIVQPEFHLFSEDMKTQDSPTFPFSFSASLENEEKQRQGWFVEYGEFDMNKAWHTGSSSHKTCHIYSRHGHGPMPAKNAHLYKKVKESFSRESFPFVGGRNTGAGASCPV